MMREGKSMTARTVIAQARKYTLSTRVSVVCGFSLGTYLMTRSRLATMTALGLSSYWLMPELKEYFKK